MKHSSLATLAYCALLLPCAHAQTPAFNEARIARVENGLTNTLLLKGKPVEHYSLAERMEHYHVHGLSVAVIDHYQVVWAKGYGTADLKSKRPVTARTLFQAGSISKPVAAVAAMRFVQDGKLNLDENVNLRLKSWHVPDNEFTRTEKVTLRRILSHSAGLTVHGFPGYAAGEPVPTVQQVLDGVKPANTAPVRVDIVPGTVLRYSGGGYTIMQLLLTETAGEPFAAILKQTVLGPIGMTDSTYEQPLPTALRNRAAFAYKSDGSAVPGDYHTYPERAAAGLWTTAPDLALFGIEIQKSREGRSNRVLSEATTNSMLTRQKDDDALGFFMNGSGPEERFGHDGANAGYQALMQFTFDGKGFAIVTNSDNGLRVGQELAYSIAAEYHWKDYGPRIRAMVQVPHSTLLTFVGKYQIPRGPLLTITASQDHLIAHFDQEQIDLYPETPTKYFGSIGPDVVFSKNEKGQIEMVIGNLHVKRQ
jgi:CubicO group peptidase (beta-lactamase class C family)